MPIAMVVAKNGVEKSRRKLRVTFNLVFSGNYPPNGDVIDPTQATDPTFAGFRKPYLAPESIDLINCNPAGFDVEGIVGTLNNNSKLKIFVAGSGSAAPVEHAAGAYEAAILADNNCQITLIYGRGAV